MRPLSCAAHWNRAQRRRGQLEVLDASVVAEVREPGERPVGQEEPAEVVAHPGGAREERVDPLAPSETAERFRERGQRLVVQRDRPRAAQLLGHGGDFSARAARIEADGRDGPSERHSC